MMIYIFIIIFGAFLYTWNYTTFCDAIVYATYKYIKPIVTVCREYINHFLNKMAPTCKSIFDFIGHIETSLNNVEQLIKYNLFMYVLVFLILMIIFCKIFIIIYYAYEKYTKTE